MRNNLRRPRYGNSKNGRGNKTNGKQNKNYYGKKIKEINPLRQQLESNGPLGKVRGNAQQIYDKYKNAGNEVLSAGDDQKAQLLYQYAAHYMIMICDYNERNPDFMPIKPHFSPIESHTNSEKNTTNSQNGSLSNMMLDTDTLMTDTA